MLKCRDISELATDYTEGTLPPGRWIAVRFHLALCRMCRTYLDQLAKTRRLLAGQPLDTPPAEIEDRLVASIRPAPGD